MPKKPTRTVGDHIRTIPVHLRRQLVPMMEATWLKLLADKPPRQSWRIKLWRAGLISARRLEDGLVHFAWVA